MERVQNLGNLGDKVKVKPGYARNFLIPQGKAAMATAENLALFEQRRAELEQATRERLAAAEARAEKLRDVAVTIQAKAGAEGRLYGSVGTREIAEAINAATGAEVDRHEVLMPEGALRETGEYELQLQLHSDLEVTVKVTVVAED